MNWLGIFTLIQAESTSRYNTSVFCQAEEKYRDWRAVTKADELANYLRSN